jgi:uncharacterized phage protein gp47/JayE
LSTNVPPIVWEATGPVLPDESAVLAGVQADVNTAFGGGVNPGLNTPQGQLSQSEAAIIADKNAQVALLTNQVNPDYADGRFQDGIGRIYFIDRIPSMATVVTATCFGAANTLIPAGSTATDTSGNVYAANADITIDATGQTDGSFQCLITGPIACPATTLTTIRSAIPGWDRISNAADGVVGRNIENRADFEWKRRNSVAKNSVNVNGAVLGALLDQNVVPGVVDAYVFDNGKNTSVTKGSTSVVIGPHSLYVCVSGGQAADIAEAIWNNTSGGCDFNGTTTHTVVDTNYEVPQPSYVIAWTTATATPIWFAVQISSNPNLPANIITLVQDAILSVFNGQTGGQRARIGSTVFASKFYAAVAAVDENVNIVSLLVGLSTGDRTHTSVTVGIDQIPTTGTANIGVALV